MTTRFPITAEGLKRLEAELLQLKTVERPTIINAISEARAHGDLSENAEYHAAKEKQGFIEAKIADLEAKLSHAYVINTEAVNTDQIQFGATVEILDEESDESVIYTLVSEYESDIEKRHISIASPVARALIGKKVGDSIEVITPKGTRYYEITLVEYK